MNRKGEAETVAIMIVGVVVMGVIATIGVQRLVDLDDRIRVRTVEIPADRASTTIHTTAALDNAEVQIKLGDEYGIEEKDDGEIYLNYSSNTVVNLPGSDYGSHKLDPPVNFRAEEGTSSNLCVQKEGSNLFLSPGEC